MVSNSFHKHVRVVLVCFFITLFLSFPAAGRDHVTNIDLGVEDLTLNVGESYTFTVTYEPENPSFHSLKWNLSDESILEIDPAAFTVKALRPGTARILAESFDGYAYDICTVNVSGSLPKDGNITKSGSSFITLSSADRSKITSFSITRYLDSLEGTVITDEAFAKSAERMFMVMAAVTPGTEEAQSKLALSLGMEEAEPLRNLHLVTLRGTLDQILRYTADNADLKEVFEEHLIFAEPRTKTEEDSGQKTVTLEGHVEELTSVSTAHDLGFTGKGATVAVIDTGLKPEHPEFEDRVIGQHCFATDAVEGEGAKQMIFHSPCENENSADPKDTTGYISSYSHGSHTTGIAAGKGGIAPDANIVAIQVFTDIRWQCTPDDLFFDWCPEESFDDDDEKDRMCCATASNPQDTAKAFEYLIEHAQDYPNLTAVNLSMANSIFHKSSCDDIRNYDYFKSLLENGIIPVIASGNEYKNGSLPESACTTNSFTVGALADQENPLLASFSNHNSLVDMAAPGEHIYSAVYPRYNDYTKEYTYYEEEVGTSMAAPMVTGAFAIMKQIFPNRSPEQLKQTLIDLSKKDVSERNACRKFEIEGMGCPAKLGKITALKNSSPILDFSGLENYLASEENSIVDPVTITIIEPPFANIYDPKVFFPRFFDLTANGVILDLGILSPVSSDIVQKSAVVENHYRSDNYPELDIVFIDELNDQYVVRINNLPAFDSDGSPIAYAVIPVSSSEEITGTIYSGYVIRFAEDVKAQDFFNCLPEKMAKLPGTGFSTLRPQSVGEKPLSLNYDPSGLILEIPSIDVTADIVVVPFADNEYPVQWLGDDAGLLQGSALPGEGVSILTGHNHLSSNEAGPFAFLSQLEPGTKIFIMNKYQKKTVFTVVQNELIAADDISGLEVIANRYKNTLTLVTCENELADGGYANRRVIAAIPE